jgi:diguanylate cyclase (GGDEF)-like protein
LKESIAKAVFKTLDHERYSVTASFGLAAAPARDVSDIDTLFQSADQALYIAKAQGRNQVCVFDGTT